MYPLVEQVAKELLLLVSVGDFVELLNWDGYGDLSLQVG